MRSRGVRLILVMATALLMASGVALAESLTCKSGSSASIPCQSSKVDAQGLSGDDTIPGTSRADYILGLEGRDTVYANGGADVVYGGEGNDTLNGGTGNDKMMGEAGTAGGAAG